MSYLFLSCTKEFFLDKNLNSIPSLSPSEYDLNLQKEGVLDKNFRYTNKPIVYELYRSTTKELNRHTPIDMGDGVLMTQALKLKGMSAYSYSLSIEKNNLSDQSVEYFNNNKHNLKSIFCNQVKKHVHYKVNNMIEKFMYYDVAGEFLFEYQIRADEC